ncbi:MAG: alpha/beta hydrolase-fold protein [Holosporales bacterium]
MRRVFSHPAGRLEKVIVNGERQLQNKLGDPTSREVWIYVPAQYDATNPPPLLIDLAAYTSSGPAHLSWQGFRENLPERLDRLMGEGMLPAVVAIPDAFTSLGGNQYVNSPILGHWQDFLKEALVPEVESAFPCGGQGRRGLFGHSSGGYGALYNAIKDPVTWSAVGCLAGDMAFELVYLADMPKVANHLARYEGSIEVFMAAFKASHKPTGFDIPTLMTIAMAASYDPQEGVPYGAVLPVDLHTLELDPTRWQRWLRFDPLHMAKDFSDNLKALKCLIIECGCQDEYHLHYGARRLTKRLTALGVPHHYEEFPDGHSGLDYRLDTILPRLSQALWK